MSNAPQMQSSTIMEFAVKLTGTVKSSTELSEYVKDATLDLTLMQMVLVEHGLTLIQLLTVVLNGKIINVLHAQLYITLIVIMSALQSALNVVNGIEIMDNVHHATSDIFSIMVLVLLILMHLVHLMLLLILTVRLGTMEYVKPVLTEHILMLMEFVNKLLINVILGIMLMDYVLVAMLAMTLSMESVNFLLQILKDLLIKDVKLGIKVYVLNVLLDGFSIITESVLQSMICAELMIQMVFA